MKIRKALFAPGTSAFFFDDQRAIKLGAPHDGFVYAAQPITPGFTRVRMAGESISVLLILDDGQIALGDCAAVQYSGAGGRDPVFLAQSYLPWLETHIRPQLEGREVACFREMAADVCQLQCDGQPLHTALRSGITQALLDARAKTQHRLRAEVICAEYGLPVSADPIPIFGQTGDAPHIVMAPATIEECFHIMVTARRLAELLEDQIETLDLELRFVEVLLKSLPQVWRRARLDHLGYGTRDLLFRVV